MRSSQQISECFDFYYTKATCALARLSGCLIVGLMEFAAEETGGPMSLRGRAESSSLADAERVRAENELRVNTQFHLGVLSIFIVDISNILSEFADFCSRVLGSCLSLAGLTRALQQKRVTTDLHVAYS